MILPSSNFYPFTQRRKVRESDGKMKQVVAFSLIELLVVVAVIAVLASLSVPAFNSIGRARGVSDAAEQVATAIELARSEAVARRTYAWIGFSARTDVGNDGVQIGVVCTADGTSSGTAANLRPLGRAVLVESVTLVDSGKEGNPSEIALQTDGLNFTIGASSFNAGKSITFTPDGEATTKAAPSASDGFDPLLAIGLAPLQGTSPDTNNRATVVIDGSTGIPRIIRQ